MQVQILSNVLSKIVITIFSSVKKMNCGNYLTLTKCNQNKVKEMESESEQTRKVTLLTSFGHNSYDSKLLIIIHNDKQIL